MCLEKHWLCYLKDIPENAGLGMTIPYRDKDVEIFILKRNNKIFAYKNRCPHTGANLNWQPDVFMDYENTYIQCAIHGAKFDIETGLCVWGPCVQQSLEKVPISIEHGCVYAV